jgi:hypothetical protein
VVPTSGRLNCAQNSEWDLFDELQQNRFLSPVPYMLELNLLASHVHMWKHRYKLRYKKEAHFEQNCFLISGGVKSETRSVEKVSLYFKLSGLSPDRQSEQCHCIGGMILPIRGTPRALCGTYIGSQLAVGLSRT